MMRKFKYFALALALCFCGQITLAAEDDRFETSPLTLEDANNQVQKAVEILKKFAETKIPATLLKQAKALVIMVDSKEIGIGFTIKTGIGVVAVRDAQGQWSHPALVSLSGGGWGLKAGVQFSQLVLVYTKANAVDGIIKGKFSIGADVGVAVGPVSANVGAKTDFSEAIYEYSDSSGLVAGVGLKIDGLKIYDLGNEGLYGKKVTANDIFAGNVSPDRKATAVNTLKDLLKEKAP